ncbi:MAG TPA: hypothetical protein VGV89_03075 [Thermoplasmata archaeon]|nr:hypothetical protein [Thermoplasmata archaeon]
MAAGACPFCGNVNPPGYTNCLKCDNPLPRPQAVRPLTDESANGTPATAEKPHDGSDAPESGKDSSPGPGLRWVAVVVVIAVVIVAVLAAIQFLPQLTQLGKPGQGSTTAHGMRSDLCNETLGVNCPGNAIDLPATGGGGTSNTSGCDSLPALGPHELAWLNYTASSPIDGIVVPTGKYTGFGSFSVDPSGFLNNTTDFRSNIWFSGLAGGGHNAVVPIPASSEGWCLGWYEPGSPSTVTWNDDLVVTYQSS